MALAHFLSREWISVASLEAGLKQFSDKMPAKVRSAEEKIEVKFPIEFRGKPCSIAATRNQ
jgi:hypothetical protein